MTDEILDVLNEEVVERNITGAFNVTGVHEGYPMDYLVFAESFFWFNV